MSTRPRAGRDVTAETAALPPTIIISLDCEGKWGMADHLQPYHHRLLTDANIVAAYKRLLEMFERYEICATFAFVMAFTLDKDERSGFEILDPRVKHDDAWLSHYWRSLESGHSEGWHVPQAFELVRQSRSHEIAGHGFCHRPIGDGSLDGSAAAAELRLASDVAALKGVELMTLVFPRNEVGNLGAVRSAGYLGYRARLNGRKGALGRVGALLEEFAVSPPPQRPLPRDHGLVAIPPGRFFNWRFGLRRVVPPAVTKARWRNQLRQCARSGGIVHLWLHPHNLITGPGTAPVLDAILREMARFRDRGLVEVMTQREYCRRVGPSGAGTPAAQS